MEEPPSYHSVQVLNHSGLEVDEPSVSRSVLTCLEFLDAAPAAVCVLIASDDEVADLNRRFRRKDGPTDVLTFPDDQLFSGDIAIAGPFARRQAQVRGIPFDHELILLAIHGTLHLAGMDDEEENDRLEMVRSMYRVAGKLGLDEGEDWGSLLHREEPI